AECPRRVDHVVDDDGGAVVYLADDLHLADDVRADAALVDDGEVRIQALRERTRPLDAAGVRGDDRHLAAPEALPQVLQERGGGIEVVHRTVEEARDLAGVQVDRHHARGTRGGDQVGDQLGTNGTPWGALPVLARVSIVRDDRRNALRRRSLEG